MMGRWLALAAALGGLGAIWAAATGSAGWAILAGAIVAPAAGLALAARFAAIDAEANWPAQIAPAVRLRWRAQQAPRPAKTARRSFVRVRLGQGTDLAHAMLASHLGAAGLGVDLDQDSLLVYAADDGPAMAAHLHSLEAVAAGASQTGASS